MVRPGWMIVRSEPGRSLDHSRSACPSRSPLPVATSFQWETVPDAYVKTHEENGLKKDGYAMRSEWNDRGLRVKTCKFSLEGDGRRRQLWYHEIQEHLRSRNLRQADVVHP